LRIEGRFAAAHRLRGYKGECENLHGHNYRVEVVFAGEDLDPVGMLMDFRQGKDLLAGVLGRLDHAYLNDVEPFDRVNPTSEHIARHVSEALTGNLPDGLRVERVTCWESEGCAATYHGGGAASEQ